MLCRWRQQRLLQVLKQQQQQQVAHASEVWSQLLLTWHLKEM
jgi:hypothetical protein